MWPLNSFQKLFSFFADIPKIKIRLTTMVDLASFSSKAIGGDGNS